MSNEFYFELIYSKLSLIWTEFYLCQVTSEPVFSTLVFALNLHVTSPRIKFVYLPPLDNFLRLGKWFLTVFSAIQNVFFDDFLYPDIFSIFHFKCILIYKFSQNFEHF